MEKVKYTILVVLATLGVLFVIIMLIPDDESDQETQSGQETAVVQEDSEVDESEAGLDSESESVDEEATEEESDKEEADEEEAEPETEEADKEDNGLNIPASEISDKSLKFKSTTLDNKNVTQSVFSDYDLTIVHVWGTFCQPCIAEMGDYAKLYKELPDNVNLIAIICDVYDGIDSNVSDAKDILKYAGAEFENLRISDDVYDIIGGLQYIPSSFFVDGEGHIIGEIMDGADFNDTKKKLDSYLD